MFVICFTQGNSYAEGEDCSSGPDLGAGRDMSFVITGEGTGGPPNPFPSSLKNLDTNDAGDKLRKATGRLKPGKSYILKRSLDLETFTPVEITFSP